MGAPTHDAYTNGVGDGVPDINRNLSGKWYGYGNSTFSAWLSYEGNLPYRVVGPCRLYASVNV